MQLRHCILFASLLIAFGSCKKGKKEEPGSEVDPIESYVVMVSFDGFRWDYTDLYHTPNFDLLAKDGLKAERLIPSFPTKTFPNHYTLANGLYPDHHGIVMNSFYDEESGRYYAISNRDAVEDGYFYGGEPIWVTAEKQGCITGSYFWVGSEAEIGGYRPTYTKKYEQDFPNGQRIDSVISWLQKPLEVRPRLILWYFHEPDLTAHEAGPDSPEVDSVVMYLDSLLGVFLDKLAALPLADQVNVIVTSDHGMANISNDRKVILENHLNMDWVQEIQGYNPNFNIKARAGCTDSIYAALNDQTVDEVLRDVGGKQFGEFKPMLADLAVDKMAPISGEMARLMGEPDEIDRILSRGAQRAREITRPILRQTYDIVGMVSPVEV